MARIELSNIGGGGGGGSTTLALTTTGTSGASVLTTVPGGYSLNIPVYQGALSLSTAGTSGASTLVGNTLTIPTYQGQISLTTTGTSGASAFVGNTLNIPTYQGAISLTTTGTSGAATLVGNTLNVPQYSTAPAGSTGEIQYNNAGAFGASANLAWDNSNVRLNIGAPSAPTARFNVKGGGTTNATNNIRITNSGNTEIFKIADNSEVTIGNGSLGQINVNGLITGISTRLFVYPTTNSTPELTLRPFGTSTDMPAIQLNDNPTAAVGSNVMLIGRGASTLPFTGVTYLGNIVAGNASANSFHFGFLVSSTALSRFEAQRIFNSGNIIMQNGGTYTDAGYKLDIISASSTHALRTRAPNTNSGTDALIVQNSTPATLYRVEADGKISYLATNTAAGTTGPQTINRPSGTVNFAGGTSSLVVTNSLCTTSSIVFATVRTNDATATIKNVVPAAGSFTINLSAAATAETSVGFFIIN